MFHWKTLFLPNVQLTTLYLWSILSASCCSPCSLVCMYSTSCWICLACRRPTYSFWYVNWWFRYLSIVLWHPSPRFHVGEFFHHHYLVLHKLGIFPRYDVLDGLDECLYAFLIPNPLPDFVVVYFFFESWYYWGHYSIFVSFCYFLQSRGFRHHQFF